MIKYRLQCIRHGFNPWVGKIPWRRERVPTPVFWPRKFHCLFSFSVQGLGFCSETQQKATGHFLLIAVGEGILCAFGRHYANRGGGEGRR